jgi:hypothetical protein
MRKKNNHDVQRPVFLRQRPDPGFRRAGRHGLLPLPLVPVLVRRSGHAFTLWQPDAVAITAGAGEVATFEKTPASRRQYCSKCGGHLMTTHPTLGLVDVFASTLPTLEFKPGVHVNYAETVLPMRDGLPKLRDFPAEFGGSGEMVSEA